jgi:RimJ/RimL family protein N-acetyltransferase
MAAASQPGAPGVLLREVQASDLEVFFSQQLDEQANWMAAFAAADPGDRVAFETKWQRILADEETIDRTIVSDGHVAGYISCWHDPTLAHPEVTYWLGREFWGRGIATQALKSFLAGPCRQRPLYGRTASDNVGSRRVLERCGFVRVGSDRGYAAARGGEVDELLLVLEADAD